MLSVIRPDFEVAKEGRIFHFVSGDRRFEVNGRIILWVDIFLQINPFSKSTTYRNNHRWISILRQVYARFWRKRDDL